MTPTWLAMSPLLILLFGGLVIMLLDAFVKEKAELASVTAATLIVTALASVGLYVRGTPDGVSEFVTNYLAIDTMAVFFDVVICAGAAFSALLAGGYLREHGDERGEFYIVLLFSAFGAMVLARATDLLSLFIALETMSLGVYCLVAYRRTSARSVEGALKYFLLGSLAAAFLLFGSGLLYGATGHTDLEGIAKGIAAGADARLVLFAMMLIIAGLAFKVSAVPFHQWTPDAYEGAVTPATTFMSVVVKSAAFAVLVRILLVTFGDELSASADTGWPPVIAGLAVLTMVYGNVAAVGQTSVKRMLAYSSIAHAGYILVGIAAALKVGEEALSAVFFYLLAYTVSNAMAFGALVMAGSAGREAVSYEDLAGLGRRHPGLAVAFVLGILSLMGFPPTAGFFGKYYVFNAAVQAGGGMVWIAIIGVLSSAIGAYYYLRVLVYMFMRSPEAGARRAVPMRSGYVFASLVLAGYFVIRMGVAPEGYLQMAVEAAQQLLA